MQSHENDRVSLDGCIAVRRRSHRRRRKSPGSMSLAPADASYWHMVALTEPAERLPHIEALARIIASEAGPTTRAVKRAIGWLARNRSLLIHQPMLEMAAPGGEWGVIAGLRPMASSQLATLDSRTIAEAVLAAPQKHDVTNGATHGFDAVLQDRLAEQGITNQDAKGIRTLWRQHYGLERIGQIAAWELYQ